jgi:hypothetical protein
MRKEGGGRERGWIDFVYVNVIDAKYVHRACQYHILCACTRGYKYVRMCMCVRLRCVCFVAGASTTKEGERSPSLSATICAVLCCAVLCCAVLCCAVLCCVVVWCGVVCCAVH